MVLVCEENRYQRSSGSRAIFCGPGVDLWYRLVATTGTNAPLVPVVATNRYQRSKNRSKRAGLGHSWPNPRRRRTDARLRAPDRRRAPSGCRRRDSLPLPGRTLAVRRRLRPCIAPAPPPRCVAGPLRLHLRAPPAPYPSPPARPCPSPGWR